MDYCPLCGARGVGRIGRERYYCRECCHEWTKGGGEVKIYEVLLDGSVEPLKTEHEPYTRAVSNAIARRRAG
jgi:ribosomal protein L37AE/L43A